MRDRVWLGFNVGIESDFVFVRGIEIARVQAEINLISVWWSIDLFFCVWWRLKLTRVLDAGRESHGFSVSIEMTWFLSGWLILTRFRCGRSNMTLVQFRDQNWFVSCMGVESDLVLVSWSKLTWILCHDIRPQTGKFLTDRYVCYVLEDHTQSPLTEKLSGLSCINEQKRWSLQIPVRTDWVAQCFFRYKRTTEARSSNPTKVVVRFFFEVHFSEIHLHTTARP